MNFEDMQNILFNAIIGIDKEEFKRKVGLMLTPQL